ncbi:MAG: pseudouridine synthase, partial [Angelakisella sp.]
MAQEQRIQKALGDGGILSRRKTEEYIKAGRITVNGHRATIGQPVNIAKDIIAIDGKRVAIARKKENIYIMLNKPRGYVTTTSDELGRRCVTELTEDVKERVYPIGRLDKNTEGLLLLTNDGQFANLIMHPGNHVSKTYRLTVRPDITDEQAARLAAGVDIGEGIITQPAQVHIIEKQAGRVVIQITISEGKNRQVRRMCEAIGLEVARLKRISVGPQKLGMLQPGEWRELKKSEVIALRNAGRPSDQQLPIPSDGKPEKVGSFGRDSRRGGPRRKDGFVGKDKGGRGQTERKIDPRAQKKDYKGTPNHKSAYVDDYSFKGGYKDGKPASTTSSDRDEPSGYKGKSNFGDKPAYKGKSNFGDKPAYKGKSNFGDKPAYKGKSEFGDKPAYKGKS